MAGLTPVGVLCEILDDRNERATRPAQAIAKHNLKIISSAAHRHRRVAETVGRIAQATLPTGFGDFQIIA
jgi:3,4-dihydroxy-2-butanone 4-phosphate synthase